MSTYSYKSKTDGRIDGYVTESTLAKAKYKLWLRGANDYYKSFKEFLNDVEVKFISKDNLD